MSRYTGMEIAIIGMSGRFPGAENIRDFWDNLKEGKESVRFFTEEELMAAGEDAATIKNPSYVKANSFLEDKESFDAAFFDYRPEEARLMDPQLRLFHESCWSALEDAGYNIRNCQEKIGLFAGAASNVNWELFSLMANRDNRVDNFTASQLRDVTYLCSRISYLLNLQGPSVYVNTACSTSLVAVQRACMSLLLRECTMALAGGIAIHHRSVSGYLYEEGMINSRDGHCRTFDAAASGTIVGEGVGLVVLRRLQDAIKDRDHIYAVIKGSAVNNDGHQKISFTAPSIEGQYKAILKAINMAGIEPSGISYVEAHGTGTKLGDPVEVAALNQVFGASDKKYCALGSVKTNIGHLDTAAGIAGLIKTALSLYHRQLPASLHFQTPNPQINFADSPFYVNTELQEWRSQHDPLRAGVSSFGIGGTNAHVILEEAPVPGPSAPGRATHLLVFSARTPAALSGYMGRFRSWLEKEDEADVGGMDDMADLAYTLQTGRVAFPYRQTMVCRDRQEALSLLAAAEGIEKGFPATEGPAPFIVFMFPGQGSQYVNMCYDLYREEPAFREEADQCFALAKQLSGKNFSTMIFTKEGQADTGLIDLTENTQPLLFIMEYCLARVLIKWGIRPDSVIGHSLGEYVAACISGIFSLEEALGLVLKRGNLLAGLPGGSMLGIAISEEELTPLLADHAGISLAAVNSPSSCVVSGERETVTRFQQQLDTLGYKSKVLRTSHAFHSTMMEPAIALLEEEVGRLQPGKPEIPIIANLWGHAVTATEMSEAHYWGAQLRQPVQFGRGIGALLEKNKVVFIEVGPGKTLGNFVRSHNSRRKDDHQVLGLMRQAGEQGNDSRYLLKAIGDLWSSGVQPDWQRYYEGELRVRRSLPTYCFERTSYPVKVDAFKILEGMIREGKIVREKDRSRWYYAPSWKLKPALGREGKEWKRSCTLLLADNCGISEGLLERYEKRGEQVISVIRGRAFERRNAFSYRLDPDQPGGYDSLIRALSGDGLVPEHIIHGWSIGEKGGEYSESSCRLFFDSLVDLLRACRQQGVSLGRQVVVMTSDLHPVLDKATAGAMPSLLVGFLKVLGQEYPTISCSHIDISLEEGMGGQLLEDLYREVREMSSGKVISLRHGHRWEQLFERIEGTPAEETDPWRKRGVYLITGGLGSLGFTVAEYLLQQQDARLILLGRTKLSEPAAGEKAGTQDRRLAALKRSGGKVLYLDCDISNTEELAAAIQLAESRLGRIDGVMHAAGVLSGDSVRGIDELRTEDYRQQFLPKIKGILALDEVLGHRELDFCLVTSSLSTVLGGLGFGAYGPANIFMDYYIDSHRRQGRLKNWISVDLDGLALEGNGGEGLHKEELWEVMGEVLRMKERGRIVVSASNLQKRQESWVDQDNWIAQDSWVAEDWSKEKAEREEAGTGEPDQLDAGTRTVKRMWLEFFGKPEIGVEDDFFEIGGDSLKALTMIGRLHKVFNVDISVTEFFNHPTIKKLSEYIGTRKAAGEKSSDYAAIPKAGEKETYPLSSAQQRLYFLYEFDRSSLVYNLPYFVSLKGDLAQDKLLGIFKKLMARHESLRTLFELVEEVPVQKIVAQPDFQIEYFDVDEIRAEQIINEFVRPFNLNKAPLLRAGLIKRSPSHHILMLDMHHIITDGVSLDLLIKDFMALYNGQELPEHMLQYKDYAQWQQEDRRQGSTAYRQQFWMNEFASEWTPIVLPADFDRPAVKDHRGSCIDFWLNETETEGLRSIAEKEGVTLFMVLLSVYNILLSKLSRQQDVVVGVSVSGRPHADLENMIGLFINTLPIRNYPKGEQSFKEFLWTLKTKTLACFDNQDYPYETLIEDLKVRRDTGRNPLFDVMFVFQNLEGAALQIPGLTLEPYEREHTISKFDLTLSAFENERQLLLNIEYATSLFERKTIERFIGYFHKIISEIITSTDIRLSAISILPDGERYLHLYEYNATGKALQEETTVIAMFDRQAAGTPENTALQCGDVGITYRQLKDRSEKIACYLRDEMDIRTGDLVGILLDREEYLIPVLLGALKAGAAYIPIDPAYPAERINKIVSDARLKTLVTKTQYNNLTGHLAIKIIDIDTVLPTILARPAGATLPSVSGKDLAYVIYTSGSTGKPKGVMIRHHSLMNYIGWAAEYYCTGDKTTFPLYTSVSFDLTVTSIFTPLITGNKIVLYEEEAKGMVMEKIIAQKEVDIIKLTPSHVKIIKDMDREALAIGERKLKLIVGGEDLDRQLAKDMYDHFDGNLDIFNEYGPTEATVGCMIHRFDPDEKGLSVPIGIPINNTQIYLLDEFLEPVPTGISGELYISGDGLASGYLFNEELTEKKFIDNPFIPGKKMYKSGDLAVRLPNGRLAFKGRIDDQVKIRGFRIELGEIEHQLATHGKIKTSAVIVREEEDDKQLIAYYVSQEEIETSELRNHLSGNLPDYMIPSFYVHLQQLPLTTNGKLDRKALPDPQRKKGARPVNETQKQLVTIWADVLNIAPEMVGIHTNFYDMGGNSLKMIRMIRRVNKHFDATISVAGMFELPVIASIAEFLDKSAKIQLPLAAPDGEEGLEQRNEALKLYSQIGE